MHSVQGAIVHIIPEKKGGGGEIVENQYFGEILFGALQSHSGLLWAAMPGHGLMWVYDGDTVVIASNIEIFGLYKYAPNSRAKIHSKLFVY